MVVEGPVVEDTEVVGKILPLEEVPVAFGVEEWDGELHTSRWPVVVAR